MNKPKSTASRLARLSCMAFIAAICSAAAQADEIRIKMLDTSSSGPLAFEPDFVKVRPGDTIVFEPTQKGGHSAVSLLTPPGAKAWTGSVDKETRVRLDREGIYLYACAAHKRMGMVGVIQVGEPDNLAEATNAAREESSRFLLNKDRFERELAQVK